MSIHIDDFIGRRVHMIGVGGSSMSGLAGLLKQRGCVVSGSDNYDSYLVSNVRALGIDVAIGHAAENVHGAALVVYSAAISEENPERREAARLGIPQMERATLLGQLMEGYRHAVGVSGTHGKTTVTAMLAQALIAAGLDPAVHIGGNFDFIGGSTHVGARNVFVAEACEFHSSFLQMRPTLAVVLNIQEDHLDYYKDLAHINAAFEAFVALLPEGGVIVGNGDDPLVRGLMDGAGRKVISFGLGMENDWHPVDLRYDDTGCAAFRTPEGHQVSLRVAGDFNVSNALAALAAADTLGADGAKAARALSEFTGVHRRFEHTGTVCGVELFHDYGHNPAEMRAALSVARKRARGRLIAVMQPHTFSRVKSLFADYIHCCDAADEILITDIYAAREKDPGDIHAQMLVDAMRKEGLNALYTPTFADVEKRLRAMWREGDLVLTMGCGNINELNDQLK